MLAAAALLATAQIAALHGVRLDDAFITFRYGQNLALGRGLVFNPGDALLGTTSPGCALLSGLVYAAVGRELTPSVMSALGCLGWTAQAALLHALLRGAPPRVVALGASLAIGAGLAGSYAFMPLETNVVAALVLGAMVLAMRERWAASGAVLGAAIVVRPDAAIAAAAILSFATFRLRRGVARPIGAMLTVLGPWLVFAGATYGTPIPHTLGAKVHHATLAAYALHLAKVPMPSAPVMALVPLWGFAAFGARQLVRRDPRLAVLVAAGVAHGLAYLVLRPGTAFGWHLYPVALLVTATAAVGALEAAGRLAPVAAMAVVALGAWQAIDFAGRYRTEFWYGRREAVQREVGEYLRAHADPNDVFDAEEVGTVAYFSDLRASDHPGLVTRDPRAAHACAKSPSCPQPRWLVMNPLELTSHAQLCRGCAVVTAGTGDGTLFVADRAAQKR